MCGRAQQALHYISYAWEVEVCEIIWNSARTSRRLLEKTYGVRRDDIAGMTTVAVKRYVDARGCSLNSCFQAGAMCASMRIKWDETQQEIQTSEPISGTNVQTCASMMVMQAWCKTSSLDSAQVWVCPLMQLTRLTADCIYLGLQRGRVFFGHELPTLPDTCRWLIVVLVADDAKSNGKIVAHIRSVLAASGRSCV
eukprot:4226343-Pyramimonas_sp.AAC.1